MQRGCTSEAIGEKSRRPDGTICGMLDANFVECAFHALR